MFKKENVWEQLKNVVDPELNVNIVDLGLIYNIDINQKLKEIRIKMTLTSPGCPFASIFEQEIKDQLKKIGVKSAKIELVWEPAWSEEKLSDEAKEKLGMTY